jgi:hypothetical protein
MGGPLLINSQSRWQPTSEAEISQAIDGDLLHESHYLDMKRQVGDNTRQRKETAADLASFALDGGGLLIGIEEDKENRTWSLAPQSLDGLSERVEQVAASAVDPALFVVTHEVRSEADPSQGYLFVEVPASPRAPHMVEGVYYGRGDKTRVRLSDAEVVRHHAKFEPVWTLANRMLDGERDRDHVPAEQQKTGRLYVIAHPLTARSSVAVDLVRGDSMVIHNLINGVEHLIPKVIREFAPSPSYASSTATRAHGVARCSAAATGPGRTFNQVNDNTDEEDLLDIELREDGGVRVLMGRMTATWGSHGSDSAVVIADGLAVAYALRVVHWAAEIGRRSGYHGSWTFGLLATGLRGYSSSAFREGAFGFGNGPTYDVDTYRETTTASGVEMKEQPWAVADRLVGRLVRGLGTAAKYGPAMSEPQEPSL